MWFYVDGRKVCGKRKKGWLHLGEDRTQRRHRRGGMGVWLTHGAETGFGFGLRARPKTVLAYTYALGYDASTPHATTPTVNAVLPSSRPWTLSSSFLSFPLGSPLPSDSRFSFYSYVSNCVMVLCIFSNAFVFPLCFTFLIATNEHFSIFHLKSIWDSKTRTFEIRVQFYIFKVFFFFLIVLSLLYRYTFTRNNVQQVYV